MEENEFGDFAEVVSEKETAEQKKNPPIQPQFNTRIRQPRQGQFAGVVLQRLGGNRMSIKSTDNKIRNCRVPGRFKRRFWLRPGDAVIIEPWADDDDKGDIIFQYRKNEAIQMKKKGILKGIEEGF